ncbi:MAG: hypothetical protein QGH42_10770 [Kiritimatiellia bacterium]|mgnify:CR=1 FL=1|jgi:hypothetical protein|nr:hypothetical protein [Pseudomonadales bacterium]MDP6473234.1 hypothetical protein [Pseudomonadales bacterium]MDP6829159.1 hypothetical protein [Pseudomonadales bacterium]MDP7024706.1 hypothetical protein [Kiritimatiellia bacterium]|tara:strand:+ start:719 stop:1225 length:507 start_codon:yes stop_codon:yes gene_type:complete
MNPSITVILRTLKASLEEHVIPELDSNFARGQAGQVAVTLDWLAEGFEKSLQKVREGNAGVTDALETVSTQLQRLAEDDTAQSDHWNTANDALRAALSATMEDSSAGERAQQTQLFEVLDDLVIAAGVPRGGDEGTGPLWAALHQALVELAQTETYMGTVPLPKHHWR